MTAGPPPTEAITTPPAAGSVADAGSPPPGLPPDAVVGAFAWRTAAPSNC